MFVPFKVAARLAMIGGQCKSGRPEKDRAVAI